MFVSYDKLGDLQRIQKKNYAKIEKEVVSKLIGKPKQSCHICTDRTTMERKEPKKQV